MNAIDLLKNEHRRISKLVNRVVSSAETDALHDLKELRDELQFHNAMPV